MSEPHEVVVAPEALLEIVRIAAWWREHRPAAPDLFRDEMDASLVLIGGNPSLARGPAAAVSGTRAS